MTLRSTCRVFGRRFLLTWMVLNVMTNRTVCSWRCLYAEQRDNTEIPT